MGPIAGPAGLEDNRDTQRDIPGYAFYAEGKEKEGKIVILVGLEDKETIKGIIIISHGERMGWGEGMSVPLDFISFVDQFVGLKIASCSLKKDGGQVDSITGATISSKAVVEAVKQTALEEIKSIR
jgi:electron transport complex protein RnfG